MIRRCISTSLPAAVTTAAAASWAMPQRRAAHAKRTTTCCYGRKQTDNGVNIEHIADTVAVDDLHHRIAALEAAVRERDAVIQDMVRVASAVPPECAEAADEAELLSMLTSLEGPSRIRLPAGTVYAFEEPIPVKLPPKRQLEIFGGEDTVIVGNIAIAAGASLTATGVRFQAINAELPAIEVASKGTLALRQCTVAGGRDGVYLSSKATASLIKCSLEDNVRGVFESLRCRLSAIDCAFVDNLYHVVLLGSGSGPSPSTPAAAAAAAASTSAAAPRTPQESAAAAARVYQAGHAFSGDKTRADVVLSYNPICDGYSDAFKGGAPHELSEEEATANLVDPTW